MVHYTSQEHNLLCVCFLQQQLYQCTYMYMYIVMSCIMVRTELKGLTKKSSLGESLFPCIIVHCTIMYVCSYDLHYNVLWGRYVSELKGSIKKLLFSILPRKKNFHTKLQVHCATVFECYFSITSSCIVMYVHACVAL